MGSLEIVKHKNNQKITQRLNKALRRQIFKTWLKKGLLLTFGFFILSTVIFALATYLFYIPDIVSPERLMNRNNTGLILTDRQGIIFFKSETVKEFTIVAIDKIPEHLKQATIAIEDRDFYQHPGFSLKSIIRAVYHNLLTRSPTRYGASTITQQLTLSESAILASISQAPSRLNQFSGDLEALYNRQRLVLDEMAKQGYISNFSKELAQSSPIVFAPPPPEPTATSAPHFAVWVRDYLCRKYGEDNVNRLGFRVKTTLDLHLQREAQEIVKKQVQLLANQQVTNGALVALKPESGEILSMVGSVDWHNEEFGKFNVAFALRQPGSASEKSGGRKSS